MNKRSSQSRQRPSSATRRFPLRSLPLRIGLVLGVCFYLSASFLGRSADTPEFSSNANHSGRTASNGSTGNPGLRAILAEISRQESGQSIVNDGDDRRSMSEVRETPDMIPSEPNRLDFAKLERAESLVAALELIPSTCGWEKDTSLEQIAYWQEDRRHSNQAFQAFPNHQQVTANANQGPYLPAANHTATSNTASAPNTSSATNTSSASTGLGDQPNTADDPHWEIFSRTRYPSATECASCHQQIYDEWAISGHAYAAVSPTFHRFEQKINALAQGTVGYFCLRCHAPVATSEGLRRDQAIWDGPLVFREGVTCVACHRVNEQYGKVNGERRMVTGDLSQPVYSSGDGSGTQYAIENGGHFSVRPSVHGDGPGQTIHRRAIQFEQLSRSDFCVSCHQVAIDPQIKLEVVWDQYRASPAHRAGVSCQDCHMGRVPGIDAGYSVGPIAVINERVVNPARKHSNHVFYGPGSSIAHPGIFPQNKDATRWSFNDWLDFDWRAGWGTDEFEEMIDTGQIRCWFPPAWSNVDDRYDAREIIDENLERLAYKNELRRQVMENGSHIDGPFFRHTPRRGQDLHLCYNVMNTNSGHNLPSGSLGAQPQVWLNVVLTGPDGRWLWESGYLDSFGDLADLHSHDVLHDLVPHDDQLFNLQTKFLTTNIKGTDREMYLPINIDIDQLPFIRPGNQPISVMNHPPFIRMEGHSLPPLGSRLAQYVIPGELLTVPGQYRLSVRMRSRSEPIYFMKFIESTDEMIRSMNESITDVHGYSVQFVVH